MAADPRLLTDRKPDTPEDDSLRDFHTEHQILNMGPSHPATHGTVKFLIELDGESIVDLDIQVGYLHRGFEKECEGGTWYQAIPYTDRLNYASSVLANTGFCLAVEKLLEMEPPERCQWLRTLAGELSRVADHLTRCGAACLELAAMTPFLYGIEARELIWDLLEELCGARVTANFVRIGGVKHDMPPDFPALCRESIATIRKLLADFDAVITSTRSCAPPAYPWTCARRSPTWSTIGSTSTSPSARWATTTTATWCAWRRCTRACASWSSAWISSRSWVLDPQVRLPAKGKVFNRMEELIQQFKTVTQGPRVPAGEGYFAIESANGELGFYLVSDGSAVPYKVRCRPPSFINVAPMAEMLRGSLLADLIPTFDFVNMIGGECDR
jgi:NADH-quinone oxidoreductase subunit D